MAAAQRVDGKIARVVTTVLSVIRATSTVCGTMYDRMYDEVGLRGGLRNLPLVGRAERSCTELRGQEQAYTYTRAFSTAEGSVN